MIKGNIVDIHNRRIFPGIIHLDGNLINSIEETDESFDQFILPGFVDAHIHIESSMLVPYEFAKIALRHGTVATVSDPHEIANVLGVEGVHYMIENAKDAKLKFHFGAPSCVPATSFETAGAVIDSSAIETLLQSDDIFYLSEMMNYPGVLHKDPEVMRKLELAKNIGKPIDGHAPGLRGEKAAQYIAEGISTDHECFTLGEALDKLENGMQIIIREGSAAKNFDALHPLIKSHPQNVMFCSDDKHPDELLYGHIDKLVIRSLNQGYDLFDVLHIACKKPVSHYNLDVGLLREGDKADFIVVKDLESFALKETYIEGELIAVKERSFLPHKEHSCPNNFTIGLVEAKDFAHGASSPEVQVINAIDGQLITEKSTESLQVENGLLLPDAEKDILKIAVVNRYKKSPIATGFIKNFGFNSGAIASTVAHDSHNIVVVGSDDELMAQATNLLVDNQGGLSAVNTNQEMIIPLPVAGLMSDQSCEDIGAKYAQIDAFVKRMGSTLTAPFMTLSFMALLVIPKIKMSDKGLFDAESFQFID